MLKTIEMKVCRYSEVIKQQMVPYGISGREDPETNFNDIVEPNRTIMQTDKFEISIGDLGVQTTD